MDLRNPFFADLTPSTWTRSGAAYDSDDDVDEHPTQFHTDFSACAPDALAAVTCVLVAAHSVSVLAAECALSLTDGGGTLVGRVASTSTSLPAHSSSHAPAPPRMDEDEGGDEVLVGRRSATSPSAGAPTSSSSSSSSSSAAAAAAAAAARPTTAVDAVQAMLTNGGRTLVVLVHGSADIKGDAAARLARELMPALAARGLPESAAVLVLHAMEASRLVCSQRSDEPPFLRVLRSHNATDNKAIATAVSRVHDLEAMNIVLDTPAAFMQAAMLQRRPCAVLACFSALFYLEADTVMALAPALAAAGLSVQGLLPVVRQRLETLHNTSQKSHLYL